MRVIVGTRGVVILAFCLLVQACGQIDDYMLGKDNTPEPTPLSVLSLKETWSVNWTAVLGKPSKTSTYLKLKPVLQGNRVYVAHANGLVQSIHASSGKIVWSTVLPLGVVSGPTVSEGAVVVGTTRSKVAILRQSDGQEQKELAISGDALSKPLISQHKLFIKTIDGYLVAFDLKTGNKLWGAEHGSPSLMLKASASPVLMDKLLLVGFSDGKLDAIDRDTGRVIWQRSIAYASGVSDVERLVDIDADPIVRGDLVYLASYQGYIGALSLSTGQFVWRKPGSVYKNMAMDASTLYVTDSEDVIWAFDRLTGQVKWKQLALKARGVTEPILLGHRLIVGDKSGYLHVLSTQQGTLVSRVALNGPIEIAPVASKRSVYVMTANGELTRLSVRGT